MSTYLLLRNNKESGPHSLEDLRTLSLKPYDLVWVEGKSAAWRYPGEINELKSFAPEVVEQPFDRFFKKPAKTAPPAAQQADHNAYVPHPIEPARIKTSRSVYINLPAATSNNTEVRTTVVPAPAFSESLPVRSPEPAYVSPLVPYQKTKKTSLTAPLAIAGIVLLFGTGIVTGYLLSNRGISSSTINRPKAGDLSGGVASWEPVAVKAKQVTVPPVSIITEPPPVPAELPASASLPARMRPKKEKPVASIKQTDTMVQHRQAELEVKENESNKPAPAKSPENIEEYVTVKAGKYSVGTFGGISNLQISVNNEAPVTLDLVVVEVQYIQSNKKIFKTENLYFHNVTAGSLVEQAAPASPRGVKIKYRINMVNAKSVNYSFTDM